MKTLNPLGDRIVMRRADAATKTPGGLELPDVAQGTPIHEVIAVGPDVEYYLEAGHKVILEDRTGIEVTFGNEVSRFSTKLIVARARDVIGIVEEKE